MLLTRKRYRRQSGFTLVELMVAAALSITIMWILSESFKIGIDFARTARSTGDMMTQLNNAGQMMMRDLQAQHFSAAGAMRNPNANAMPDTLSTQGMNAQTNLSNLFSATGYTPPAGYFRLVSPPPQSSIVDNSESYSITTTNPPTVTATGAQLQFTSFLPQGLPQNQFVATAPPGSGNIYFSRAAEIGYFIAASGLTTEPIIPTPGLLAEQPALTANPQLLAGQPLYNLYRRQRLVAVNTDYAQLSPVAGAIAAPPNLNAPITPPTPAQPNPYYDPNAADVISFTVNPANQPQRFQVNTLASFGLANTYTAPPAPPVPATRVPMVPLTTAGRVGDDIVISNVLSFEVLAAWNPVPYPAVTQPPPNKALPPQAIPFPRPFTVRPGMSTPVPNIPGAPTYPTSTTSPLNSNYPFDYLPLLNLNLAQQHTFDTWYQIYPNPKNANQQLVQNWNNFALAPFNPNLIPMPARITALQITIRIYDPKTKQARQNTWRVAM